MTAIDTAAPSTFRLTRTTAVLGAVGLSLLANLALWLVGLAAGGEVDQGQFGRTEDVYAVDLPGAVLLTGALACIVWAFAAADTYVVELPSYK